ncbi:hypothetical protein [Desulfolutivibrio sp.]|uniref:hypothetical protein n=1 Tax=Desulfolutivibrio sp. TaxID=2773296 RepID=UPI002F961D59
MSVSEAEPETAWWRRRQAGKGLAVLCGERYGAFPLKGLDDLGQRPSEVKPQFVRRECRLLHAQFPEGGVEAHHLGQGGGSGRVAPGGQAEADGLARRAALVVNLHKLPPGARLGDQVAPGHPVFIVHGHEGVGCGAKQRPALGGASVMDQTVPWFAKKRANRAVAGGPDSDHFEGKRHQPSGHIVAHGLVLAQRHQG